MRSEESVRLSEEYAVDEEDMGRLRRSRRVEDSR